MKEIEIGSIKKIHCNTCKVDTHHQLKAKHRGTHVDEYGISEDLFSRFWICRGCDTATLETIYIHMTMSDGEKLCEFSPKREFSDSHLTPKHFFKLNKKLEQIYKEIIQSFNNDAGILCTIGLRALLEGICADKGVKVERNLRASIDGLKEYLPLNIVKNLRGFGFMGNKAAHELDSPERYELLLAIDIVEDLLNFLYELEYKSQDLLELSKKETEN